MLPDPTRTLIAMPLVTGSDGRARCGWAGTDPVYLRYHDEEWGVPLHGDRALFEKLCLEGFQSGLSWITILKRRDAFRAAFANFDPEVVANSGDDDIARLMDDASIIRNRAKIVATIGNARALLELQRERGAGSLDELVWSHAPAARNDAARPSGATDLVAQTPESVALSKELRALGFRFVGPVTMYALMQSGGLVDDHLVGCWRAG